MTLLRPYQLLGVEGMDPYTHAVFWSMLVNIGGLVAGSLIGRQDPMEQVQGSQFVNIFERDRHDGDSLLWRGVAETAELHDLLARFLGRQRADDAFTPYAREHGGHPLQADSQLPAMSSM